MGGQWGSVAWSPPARRGPGFSLSGQSDRVQDLYVVPCHSVVYKWHHDDSDYSEVPGPG
jgi:hypothetical protein